MFVHAEEITHGRNHGRAQCRHSGTGRVGVINCKRVVLSLVKGNELQCTVHLIHSFRDKAQAMRKSGDEKVCWRCEKKENV